MSSASAQPGSREAERRRVGRAEALEHGQEAGGTRRRQPLDDPPQRRLFTERHDELVLQEASAPVEAVPRVDEVQRVEVPRDRHDLRHTAHRRRPEPHLVEGGHRQVADDATRRHDRWNGQQLAWLVGERIDGIPWPELRDLGVLSTGQHAASEADAHVPSGRSTPRSTGSTDPPPPSARATHRGRGRGRCPRHSGSSRWG